MESRKSMALSYVTAFQAVDPTRSSIFQTQVAFPLLIQPSMLNGMRHPLMNLVVLSCCGQGISFQMDKPELSMQTMPLKSLTFTLFIGSIPEKKTENSYPFYQSFKISPEKGL